MNPCFSGACCIFSWRDTSGNTSIWFMNGTAVASSAGVGNIPINWTVVGTGDFNGDGMSDIVWRDRRATPRSG
jgi:hypothetical protein